MDNSHDPHLRVASHEQQSGRASQRLANHEQPSEVQKTVVPESPVPNRKVITFHFGLAGVRKQLGKLRQAYQRILTVPRRQAIAHFFGQTKVRVGLAVVLIVLLAGDIFPLFQSSLTGKAYALGNAETLLSPKYQPIADKLKFDAKQQAFVFNAGYSPQSPSNLLGSAGPQMTATAAQDAAKGVVVTDPVNKIDFTIKPKFGLYAGRQDGNRVVYPLSSGDGWLVYTMHAIGVKEDMLLNRVSKDKLTFDYTLGLDNNLVAKVLKTGDIGVYGNTTLSGNVATSTEKDAELLQKARQKASKDTLLFMIPAPTIAQYNKKKSAIKASYTLQGSNLRLNVSGLQKGKYPLTIDPSIYVETAQKFMNGNNETNIDFDVADTLIQKGKTTGARFNSWNSTMSLNTSLWGQGVAVAGGYVYTVGGQSFNGKVFSSAGNDTYLVPSGVTTVTVKSWGAGGGGGAGSGAAGLGGSGGGGGYAQADITVTPGETLTVQVGSGGSGAANNTDAGNGGGFSAVKRSSTFLVQAGGGGGGGGSVAGQTGGAGGAGGGTSGVAGGNGTAAALNGTAGSGGGGGTSSGGGTSGATGTGGSAGAAGAANAGGNGGGSATNCNTSVAGQTGGAGGTGAGGSGGSASACRGGGGGGGGRFGGGGGGSASDGGVGANRSGGGGGGGSDLVTGANTVQTAGSGTTPGNSSDSFRNGAGVGGSGATSAAGTSSGSSGLVVIIVTGATSSITGTVNWAKFNTTDGSITSTDPGAGACSGWCTTSAYDLPSPRANLAMVAYNGFLYAFGGEDSSCTTGNATGDSGVCKTVYIAKLGANGEPRLWHPTDSNQANWVYWYRASDLSSPRSYVGAVAYNNRIYLLGGKTSSGGVKSVVSTVEEADVTGNGALTSWTTSGMVTLRDPANSANALARYGFGIQAYNNHLYVIGGSSSLTTGSPSNSVQYVTLNSDGTMSGNWISTKSFSVGRMTNGGNFTTAWGAYIYLSGGCTAYNANGFCTAIASDTQLASINADGSLDTWATNAGVSDTRMGHNIVAWRSNIYEVGGCNAQDGTTGACTGTLSTINYGTINQDGDASTVNQSVASGTVPCSGATPISCNLPTSVGNVLNATAIMNGYLYIMGGCTNNACSSVSQGVTYQAIASDGTLQKPAACTGTYTDSYCVSSSSLPSGLAAAGTAIFNGRIYLVGGFNVGNNVNYVTVNTDGSLSAWSTVSLNTITAGVQPTLTYAFAYARANPSSAGTTPGNLYIFGGCTDGAVGCSGYSDSVFKCNISTTGAPSACTTSGQLQIGTLPAQIVSGTPTSPTGSGLGAAAGAVYANYIYLIGGLAPGITDMETVRYAKFDNNNNVVAVSGSAWTEGSNHTQTGRRRGAGFGYNGYLYVVGGYDGTGGGGVLADIEFAKINVSNGSWEPFTTSSVTINQRWGLAVPVSNSYAYVVGGCTAGASPGSCTTRTSTVQTFQVYNNDSGAPASYSTAANTYGTNPNRIGASATVLNGYLYVAGGCTSTTDCTTAVNTVSYTAIDANGGLGSWSNTTGTFAGGVVRAWGKLLAAGGTLYYVGGQDSTATNEQSTVFYGTPSSGDVSTWSTASNGLPAARTKFGATVWNNRMYVVGGLDSNATATATVYVSPQLNSGGDIGASWSTSSTSLNVARYGAMVTAYANNLYVFGGNDGTNFLSDGQYSQINASTGNSGSWTYTTNLPSPLAQGEAFAANGYMYLVGGRSASATCRPIMLVAPISANTTIASGNNPTGVGEWYETNAKYTGDRYGAAAAYSGGKTYVLGGGCGATLTYASPVTVQTALLSQPQIAQYSIMFDTDKDVYPAKWLLNGLDNSIGARWQLAYRSMTDPLASILCSGSAMSTWGQTTNVGNVTLGTPGTYTAKDGSGANTNCARYFYLMMTIDSSQAFGYPEDITRGPTITDLTFEFTANPANRLLHGRTFTGGLQQPDDTPF